MIKTETFILPAFFAPALINSDLTGLTDNGIDILDKFVKEQTSGLCIGLYQQKCLRALSAKSYLRGGGKWLI